MEERDPIVVLGGTALRVYLYLAVRGRPVGVREVQRALGFRSPSTARHHLERLVELGLAEKTGEGYIARGGGLFTKLFIVVHGRLVPRLLVAVGFLASALTAYVLLPGADPIAALVMLITLLLLAPETYNVYRYALSLYRHVEGKD